MANNEAYEGTKNEAYGTNAGVIVKWYGAEADIPRGWRRADSGELLDVDTVSWQEFTGDYATLAPSETTSFMYIIKD